VVTNDGDISRVPRISGAIDDVTVADDEIVLASSRWLV